MKIGYLVQRILRAARDAAYNLPREQLAHELFGWHGGTMTGLYMVSAAWLEGREAEKGDIDRAIAELQHLLDDEVPQSSEMSHVRELKQTLEAEKGSENP